MCRKNREKEYIENKYKCLRKNEKQNQKYRKNMTKNKNIKIIKNNIEKIRPMNKNKK